MDDTLRLILLVVGILFVIRAISMFAVVMRPTLARVSPDAAQFASFVAGV